MHKIQKRKEKNHGKEYQKNGKKVDGSNLYRGVASKPSAGDGGKNYKVKVCKKHIKVASTRLYNSIAYMFDESSDEMLAFLHRYCAEDVNKTSTDYINLFREADLRSRVAPVTRDLRVKREMDCNGCETESWFDTYVEYRIPLDRQDVSSVIRAAKIFAGLE